MNKIKMIKERLLFILSELENQKKVGMFYADECLSYSDEMNSIKEFIELANECGIAYETIVSTLEAHPFILSSKAAIKLLEAGLLLGFKTEHEKDKIYDIRKYD